MIYVKENMEEYLLSSVLGSEQSITSEKLRKNWRNISQVDTRIADSINRDLYCRIQTV